MHTEGQMCKYTLAARRLALRQTDTLILPGECHTLVFLSILNAVIMFSALITLDYSWMPSLPPPELFDTGVTSHSGCGALEMYLVQMGSRFTCKIPQQLSKM